ncbi:hypothetical protein L1987_35494 [Smallanthus sonchifolius]|uniref:Uncharacterized protein n=1 Tax=Smallanthus sonchifolius TaxID=185202 RepID=A0ACB9HW51_9ASTR|nr:hypothetical protein L1987_35494 [Smallanthus sonchifolius]
MRKGRTSLARRPRKPGTDSLELIYNIQKPAAFERKKSGILKVVDAPSKKRRLLHQSTSPPAQTPCINGEGGLSPGPQTPSVHHEEFGQRCWSSAASKNQKTKSKTRLRKSKMKLAKKEVLNFDDFSGIELLADVACSSFIHENADHAEYFSVSKEHTTPEVNLCSVDIKEAIVSPGSNGLAIQPKIHDIGKEVEEKKVASYKGLRLHWDLNTVMDEWEDPCDDFLIESVKHDDASISVVPLPESCNVDSSEKVYELVEDLEVAGTKMVTVKTSDGESSASKSEVVDSLIHPAKCEDVFTSTTSVLKEQTVMNCESDTIDGPKLDQHSVSDEVIQGFCDNKVTTEDHVSECCCSKTVTINAPYGEGSASKSEVVDSSAHSVKCEDFSTSTTSVLKEQTVASCESDTIDGPKLDQQLVSDEVIQGFCDDKVTTEDHVSECCCSNDTLEEQGDMAVGDSEDKIQAGYDSPFEDGELREPIEKPEKEAIYKESDNLYKVHFGTIETPLSEKADHGQTVGNQRSMLVKEAIPNNEIDQGVQVDTFERPHIDESRKNICERKDGHADESRPVGGSSVHIDESTSSEVHRSGEYIHRSRSGSIGDSSMRVWDLKSHRSLDRNYSRNYNSRGGGYMTQDRRPSPSERNNGYGSYRGPPARSYSGDRYRYHSQEYHDPKPCYLETKSHFPPNFNRPGTRSRSRSGSPIAWHFQKCKNLDTRDSGEIKTGTRGIHASPERSFKCFDDHHRFRDGPFRDNRQTHVTMIQQKQRYPERLKPDDYFRFNQRPARFSELSGYKYKDNSDDIRKHDGFYEKVNLVGRSVDDGVRRFRYAHNRE